jgi:hypothetical protein
VVLRRRVRNKFEEVEKKKSKKEKRSFGVAKEVFKADD